MSNDRFYERRHSSRKKRDKKSKKSDSFIPYQKKYSLGNLLSDVGNRDIARFFESGLLQAKLNVGQPGDIYEQEADRIAKNIVNTNSAQVPKVSRVQSKAGTNDLSVQGNTESIIKSLKGKGNPLNKPIKEYFEPRFGVDLGNIRVHTDNNANLLAKSIYAKAFTYGNDIAFDQGQYQPNTLAGKQLIAHELTHTIQQDGGQSEIVQRREAWDYYFIGHKVVSGDTLSKLARDYNTTVDAIKDMNPQIEGRTQPDQINIGEMIKIPTQEDSPGQIIRTDPGEFEIYVDHDEKFIYFNPDVNLEAVVSIFKEHRDYGLYSNKRLVDVEGFYNDEHWYQDENKVIVVLGVLKGILISESWEAINLWHIEEADPKMFQAIQEALCVKPTGYERGDTFWALETVYASYNKSIERPEITHEGVDFLIDRVFGQKAFNEAHPILEYIEEILLDRSGWAEGFYSAAIFLSEPIASNLANKLRINDVVRTVNGQQVIQNNKLINPDFVDDLGRTNLQRMQNGLAPIGPDGKSINLHHFNQTMTSPIIEMTATYHQQNYSTLHTNTGQSASLIDRTAFNTWRIEYWKIRVGDF